MTSALRGLWIFLAGMGTLSLAALAMAATRLAMLGGGRRLCQETLGAWAGDALLRQSGLELVVHRDGPWPEGPCFYMSNHSSSLDLPILMSLRIPNARTFIKERFRWYGPLGAVLMLTGTFFTRPQEDHERRVQRFVDAERVLRQTGESVFGSPEGTRVEGGRVGPFNRGVFHIAMNLKMPIVPLLIHIPRDIDPGRGLVARAGAVHVYVGAPIPTSGWRLEDLDAHKEATRARFLRWQEEVCA